MRTWLCVAGFLFMAGVAHANDTVTNSSNKLIVACDSSTLVAATNGVSKVVSIFSGKRIYICGYSLTASAGGAFQIYYGIAGTTCNPATTLTGNIPSISSSAVVMGGGLGTIFQPSPAGFEMCINNETNQILSGFINWTQL